MPVSTYEEHSDVYAMRYQSGLTFPLIVLVQYHMSATLYTSNASSLVKGHTQNPRQYANLCAVGIFVRLVFLALTLHYSLV